ncbi:MAG TPA: DUF3592 domain-containing protein [Cellvibrio sp.]|nr:DUF3592 domain-containing protein [Cellvibrio sp.]
MRVTPLANPPYGLQYSYSSILRGDIGLPKKYIPALLLFILSLAATIYFFQLENGYIKNMHIVQGEIVGFGGKSGIKESSSQGGLKTSTFTHTQAIANFSKDGSIYRVEGRAAGFPRWQLQQKIEIYYSLENPKKSRINRFDELYFYTLLSGVLPLYIFLAFMFRFGVNALRKRPLFSDLI